MFMGYAYKIQQQHDSSDQETGFYSWFQMPCGNCRTSFFYSNAIHLKKALETSGTAGLAA